MISRGQLSQNYHRMHVHVRLVVSKQNLKLLLCAVVVLVVACVFLHVHVSGLCQLVGMVPVAASHSPVVTHARSSTNQMNLQPSSSTPITRRAAGGSVYEDTNSRGYYSPASSSDGARRSESSNFGEMLATMQQQLIEETSSQSRQTPNQNEAVRTGRTGTPVDIRLAQSASNSNSDWSRSERTTSRVARDWSQQSSGGGAQTMQSSMQTTQVSTTNWPSEVTSTMVRRSNGSETSPGYNGLGQVGNSRFEPQVGPLLQNGLNGSVTRIAVQHPANAEQMTAAMDNRNNQMKSVPDRNNNRQSANELLIPTSRDRADSRLNNMSSYPGLFLSQNSIVAKQLVIKLCCMRLFVLSCSSGNNRCLRMTWCVVFGLNLNVWNVPSTNMKLTLYL